MKLKQVKSSMEKIYGLNDLNLVLLLKRAHPSSKQLIYTQTNCPTGWMSPVSVSVTIYCSGPFEGQPACVVEAPGPFINLFC